MDMLLTAILRCRRYDVALIDLYSGRAFIWGEVLSICLKFLNRPFIFVLHGGALPDFAQRWPRRVQSCLRRAIKVTSPSGYLLDQMRIYRPDVTLLPNPLDVSAYSFELRHAPQPRLTWLRAFHSVYNPGLAPEVTSLLQDEFPNIELTMIGPDKKDGSLQQAQQTARELNVQECVTWPGAIAKAEVPAWLNKADIFLNTTNVDNTPVSVLEAMACGLCVVTTNVGGIPYLVTHEYDALLVPPDDPEAMASAVRRILTEPGLAKRLSTNARRTAEQFDWSVILPQWEQLLQSVVAGTRPNEAIAT